MVPSIVGDQAPFLVWLGFSGALWYFFRNMQRTDNLTVHAAFFLHHNHKSQNDPVNSFHSLPSSKMEWGSWAN